MKGTPWLTAETSLGSFGTCASTLRPNIRSTSQIQAIVLGHAVCHNRNLLSRHILPGTMSYNSLLSLTVGISNMVVRSIIW
jgi:hypothetical protein